MTGYYYVLGLVVVCVAVYACFDVVATYKLKKLKLMLPHKETKK